MSKIFIVGLPRTGTTSVCAALLRHGFLVAHTAYTDAAFDQADVVGDTPVFHEFERLDTRYPGAKFIYLARNEALWLPSIKTLLTKINRKGGSDNNPFHPVFVRCFREVFGVFDASVDFEECLVDSYLSARYAQHHNRVLEYFKGRPQDLLSIEVSQAGSFTQLLRFLDIANHQIDNFESLNKDGVISDWHKIAYPNKVGSHLKSTSGSRVLTYV
ncbi:MAG: sulfotransferase family protein [Agarilytica sp.]